MKLTPEHKPVPPNEYQARRRGPHPCTLCGRAHDACCTDTFCCNEAKRRSDETAAREAQKTTPKTAEVFS